MRRAVVAATLVAALIAAPVGAAQFLEPLGGSCTKAQHGSVSGDRTCARTAATTWQWVETLPTGGKPIRNGQWLVWSEVAPGRYRSPGAIQGEYSAYCSAGVYDGNDGVLGGESADGVGQPVILLITKTAYKVTVTGCLPFVKIG